jgi:hypothetical protein
MLQTLTRELKQVMPEAAKTGLFVSFCTIQQPDGNVGPSGAPSNVFVNVIGLVNIACIDAVPSQLRIQATELRTLADIMSKSLRHVLLNGYFPQLLAGQQQGWRAIVDGVTYTLMGVEFDSQNTQSRLHLELATV